MTRDTKTYGHFCLFARVLEQLGDRWTLLVVRDLLVGPRRFTDLVDRLGGITPKTLSQRLKELEALGYVQADREDGRREVWYELTPAGRDLEPALGELFLFGLRHALQPPRPGEILHPEHQLLALRIVLERTSRRRSPVTWSFQFRDDGAYTLRFDGEHWLLEDGDVPDADVVVTATIASWMRYITARPPLRPHDPEGVEFAGTRAAADGLRRALEAFPFDVDRRLARAG